MPFSLRKLTKAQFTAICLTLFLGIAALAVTQRNFVSPTTVSKPATRAASKLSAVPVQQNAKKMKEIVNVKLSPEGFFPSTIVIPKDAFFLVINNRTGLQEMNLNLVREKSNDKLQEKKLKQESMSLEWELNLPAGNYQLREVNHPDWILSITEAKNKQ